MVPAGGIVPGPLVEQASRAAVSPGAARAGSFGNVGRPLPSAPRSRKSVRSLAVGERGEVPLPLDEREHRRLVVEHVAEVIRLRVGGYDH